MTEAAATPGPPELEEFRRRVRAFLDEHVTSPPRAGGRVTPEQRAEAGRFQAALFDAGLAGVTIPTAYGGAGLTDDHQRVFDEEASRFESLPSFVLMVGLGMCAPTILALGTDEQRRRYLPALLRGDDVWCQLFSEPGAGSDVASLATRAVLDGDQWVLTGQKVWTSGAHLSRYGLLLARTDPDVPKHRGITMFVADMSAPGVTVRPLRQITGEAHFNEVFFDAVRIPTDQVIGQVNDGWRATVTMLANERVAIGATNSRTLSGVAVADLVELGRAGQSLADPVIRQQVVEIYVLERLLELVGLRVRSAVESGRAPGPEASVAKLAVARLARRSTDVAMALAGAAGQAWSAGEPAGERWARACLSAPVTSIAGGTSEIQRTIVGERVLGLPREPQVDRDVAFKDLPVAPGRG